MPLFFRSLAVPGPLFLGTPLGGEETRQKVRSQSSGSGSTTDLGPGEILPMKNFFLTSPCPSFSLSFSGFATSEWFLHLLFPCPWHLIWPPSLVSSFSTRPYLSPTLPQRIQQMICSYICPFFSPIHRLCQCETHAFLVPFSSYCFPVQESTMLEALSALSTPAGSLHICAPHKQAPCWCWGAGLSKAAPSPIGHHTVCSSPFWGRAQHLPPGTKICMALSFLLTCVCLSTPN